MAEPPARPLPKSAAQRNREYRERKRLLRLSNLAGPTIPSPLPQRARPPPKTNAQKCREYRERMLNKQNGEYNKRSQITSSDLTHGALQIKSEPEAHFLPTSPTTTKFLPESSWNPMFSPDIFETSRSLLKPVKVKESDKVFCRICLKQHDKNSFLPLALGAIYHPDPSEQFKIKMVDQVDRYQEVLRVVIPDFDYFITFNPVMCKSCNTRLMNAYDFIKECRTNENLIKYYKEKHAPQENSVIIDDVVHVKSQLIKEISEDKVKKSSKRKRQATVKDSVNNEDFNQSLNIIQPEYVECIKSEYVEFIKPEYDEFISREETETDDEFTEDIKCSERYKKNNNANSSDMKTVCDMFKEEIVTIKEEFDHQELATAAVFSPSRFSSFGKTISETTTDELGAHTFS